MSENQLRDKKRKQEVMKILNSNGRYFDRPISDVVTEMTKGRKHRCKVEFTWIAHDHSLGKNEIIYFYFLRSFPAKISKNTFMLKNIRAFEKERKKIQG